MIVLLTPEQEAAAKADREYERSLLQTGKVTVRWQQNSGGYRVYCGRKLVPGLSFDSGQEGWDYLKERHGLQKW